MLVLFELVAYRRDDNVAAAADSGADAMRVPLSASHAHSLANLRKAPDEVVAEIGRIRALRDASASRCLLGVGISTAFGCTIQGRVDEAQVLRLAQAVLDAGADRVGLADTVGDADPLQVTRLFERMGVATGLGVDALIALRGRVAPWLAGEALHGSLWRAGLPKTMKDAA